MKTKAFFWTNKVYAGVLWKTSKLYFFFRVIVVIAMNVSQIFNLYFLKVFVDAITEGGNFQLALWWLALNFIVRFSTDQIISWSRVYLKQAQIKAQIEMQQKVIKKCFEFGLTTFENTNFYDMFTRAFQYASNSSDGVIATIFSIVSDFIGLSAVTYVIAKLNIWVFVILLCVVIVDLVVNMHRDTIMDVLQRRLTRVRRKQNYITTLLSQKSAFKDLKINCAEEFILKKMMQVLSSCKEEIVNVEIKTSLHKIPVRLLETLFVIITYFFIGKDLFLGKITVGDFNMTFNAAYSIKTYLITIGSSISGLRNQSINAAYFYEFFSYKSEKNGCKKIANKEKITIEFQNVFFKYLDEQPWILNDASFTISSDETTLLVGENGAGKTTIVNLLLRLYHPNQGRILVNGIDLEEYDIRDLYANIAVVFQDHQQYAFSIAENTLFIEDDRIKGTTNERTINEFLVSIGFEKINALPLGIYSSLTRELDEQGVDCSGGEKQKLALTRAFLRHANFFIMDEPSSSLDPISEENMYKKLSEITSGHKSLVISHHLSNSIYADRILVIENGHISENGCHEELLNNGKTYAKLYNLQKRKFVEE